MSKLKKIDPPNLNVVDLDWITKKINDNNLTDYHVSLMIGQTRNYIGQVRCGSRNMSKAVKSSLYYFFKYIEKKT